MNTTRELVAYFSNEGSTRIAAEAYSKKRGAKLFEIELEKVTGKKTSFMLSAFGALLKMKARIKAIPQEMFEGIEEVTIATPVWASSAAPAVNSFISKAPLENKRVNLITVQADQQHKDSEKIFLRFTQILGSRSASAGKLYSITGTAPGKTPDRASIEKQID